MLLRTVFLYYYVKLNFYAMTTFENAEQISEISIHNEIRNFMLHELGIKPVSCLHQAKVISDLGLDSLDRISLCSHLEEKYGIRLDLGPNEDICVSDLTQRVMDEHKAKSTIANVG